MNVLHQPKEDLTEKEILQGLMEEISKSIGGKKKMNDNGGASMTIYHHAKNKSCGSPLYPQLQGGSSSGGNVVVVGDSPSKRGYKTMTASLVPSPPFQSSSSNNLN